MARTGRLIAGNQEAVAVKAGALSGARARGEPQFQAKATAARTRQAALAGRPVAQN
ncbi:MAG TPA: hypothetical protein VFD64_17425 [Gemmatimonadaceae bacterium]|nr:hypothetical protein [Gemmatimonadaceae bacterium]